ncbi:hypothetical protein D9599_25175 [Roseomonas sp. KE2513]|uniref:hypothetical protein n=1 Tax=Roseomonas sp. KE2513 TaxID=2479202 RepID=UPI0018DF5AAD|nr:hypothetical protein [Roseomonas sp. KE2513]MBI0538848.1 hypothetical protein [Roseomonas sp. KE2513]
MNAVTPISAKPGAVNEALQQALNEMDAAAWDAGVSPVEPLGLLYRAQRSVLTAFAKLATGQQQAVETMIQDTRAAMDAEVERLHRANMLAEATIQQLKAAGTAGEADAEKVLAKVVEFIAPEVAAVLRDTVVVREHVHNKRALRRHYLKGAGLVLALLMVGYGAHAWQTWGATTAVQRCLENVVLDASGKGYCAVDRIFADRAQPQQGAVASQSRSPAALQPVR